MINWKEYYDSHLMTAEEAIKMVQSGDRVTFGHACSEPAALVEELINQKERLRDVQVIHMVAMGPGDYMDPENEASFRHNSLFVGGKARKALVEDRADYTPCYFYRIPELFDEALPLDVALVQVSVPDKHGYVSLNVSVDYDMKAIKTAKKVIAQVNAKVPRTLGESFVHVTEIDAFVEEDRQLVQLPKGAITDVEGQIGANCASLIKDGDCLQLGIGSIPDAVLLFLKEKNDLGIHTEMFSDGCVILMKEGNINCKAKNFMPGKAVAGFLMGTDDLYDYVDDNPMIHMAPIEWVNNPMIAGSNDNLVSINSLVQIDLMGQVCSESVGLRQISAVGGQVDFVRGACFSKGGRSILAFPATAKGNKSKIVPFLDQGAAVTTNRNDVEYIVTEYGVAQLWGKSLKDRARALISIAHPDARDELAEEFERRFPKTKYTPMDPEQARGRFNPKYR